MNSNNPEHQKKIKLLKTLIQLLDEILKLQIKIYKMIKEYKKKLKLKNRVVHGPVSFYYYILRNGKKLLLFGDKHLIYKDNQEDLSLIELLEYFIAKNQKCLDFFMESEYIDVYKKLQHGAGTYSDIRMITRLRDYLNNKCVVGSSSSTCSDGFRLHTWDIAQVRNDPYKIHPTLLHMPCNPTDMVKLYLYFIGEYRDTYKTDYLQGQKLYQEKIEREVRQHLQYLKTNPMYHNNEIMSVLHIELISERINRQLNNIDNIFFNKEFLIDYFVQKLRTALLINQRLSYIRLCLTETYVISRMFREFTKHENRKPNCTKDTSLKNIIYFGGNAHVININDFLALLNIRPIEFEDIKKRHSSKRYVDDQGYIHFVTLGRDNYL